MTLTMAKNKAVGRQTTISFIVRIWREPAATPQGPELLRGSIEHVQSRRKQYFQSVEALLSCIQAETQSPRKPKRGQPERPRRRKGESQRG